MIRYPVLAGALALACCAPPPPPPAPVPPAVQRPAPTPTPPVVQAPVYDNWLDAPQTEGTWTYRERPDGGFATFGPVGDPALFGIECSRSARSIRLVRTARATGDAPMRIRTETTERMLSARPNPSGTPTIVASVPANDPLLDAIALTRGRFAVEAAGTTTLYLPAWAEVTRAIEDCR
ncbi:hypothetical protein [Erythrobacter litoralis]|uniref:Lipoprotein n=1 Tax=Erythrobacter litoralis (strain HTCC2594) TaxID=314225 RepID=Q2N976_ERYLH|nr:hypothetical protein [Erythrobacter litoralis]ABC63765.1 hypothetical protein ELI_08365 [Erythrobacter litoralis HTCC2594]